jgi:GT2 family glycosyltransferase
MPVFNGGPLTARCLARLIESWPAPAAEIVVVDDGSSDQTAELLRRLAGTEPRMALVRRPVNGGFAAACNDGAAAARGRYLVFLNDDTEPAPGWLDALTMYAEGHPAAAAVGAKLLFPDLTIQHAGIVFDADGNPRHRYSGFPAGHPAVNRSGPVQAVTGAALLVRNEVFESLDGFDPSYRNGHEDIDFCLRILAAGHEVHYNPESVLVHLESATRGRHTAEETGNGRLFRSRWAGQVKPDDLETYQADGLVRVEYDHDGFITVGVDPRMGTAAGADGATDRLLHERSNQVAGLLRLVVAQTVAEVRRSDRAPQHQVDAVAWPPVEPSCCPDDDDDVLAALATVRSLLAARSQADPFHSATDDRTRTDAGDCGAGYRQLVRRFRSAVNTCTPPGSEVAVVSRGDPALVDFDHRQGRHFPENDSRAWIGYHPAGSDEAVALLAKARRGGVTHLAIPATALWWLDAYPGLTQILVSDWARVPTSSDCSIFAVAS